MRRVINIVLSAVNVLLCAVLAHVIWFARPRFGVMFAEEGRPLQPVTELVLRTPGWVYAVPYCALVWIVALNTFRQRGQGTRLLVNTLILGGVVIAIALLIAALMASVGLRYQAL